MSLPFPSVGAEALPRFSAGLLIRGLLWTAAAWVLLGASQLEVAHALSPLGKSEYIALASGGDRGVALATVAGFVVAVLPGGLGVREGVLMYVLGPRSATTWRSSRRWPCGWSGWPPSCWPRRCSCRWAAGFIAGPTAPRQAGSSAS